MADWLGGKFLGESSGDDEDDEAIDFGHREGDFIVFTVKLRQSDGKKPVTFFVGNMKENKIIGVLWTTLASPVCGPPRD